MTTGQESMEPGPPYPTIEPLLDTWGNRSYAGAWVATPAYGALTALGSMHAYQELFVRTFATFEGLLRPTELRLSSHVEDPAPYAQMLTHEGQDWSAFRSAVLDAIAAFRGDIYLMDCEVEVCAFARTAEHPDQPVRGWMNLGDYLTIRAGKEEPEGVVTLSVGHTLFHPGEGRGTLNRVLYDLNQPLLESALRRLEQQVGPISETDGLWPIYPYGYELLYEPVEEDSDDER